jgi:hypothetical protein
VSFTTNLTDKTSIGGNGNGLRHSDKMVITERFKRVPPTCCSINSQSTIPGDLRAAVHDVDAADNRSTVVCCSRTSATKVTAVCRMRSALSAGRQAIEEDRKNGIVRARAGDPGPVPNRPAAPAEEN